jgi:hypothetical protein
MRKMENDQYGLDDGCKVAGASCSRGCEKKTKSFHRGHRGKTAEDHREDKKLRAVDVARNSFRLLAVGNSKE